MRQQKQGKDGARVRLVIRFNLSLAIKKRTILSTRLARVGYCRDQVNPFSLLRKQGDMKLRDTGWW